MVITVVVVIVVWWYLLVTDCFMLICLDELFMRVMFVYLNLWVFGFGFLGCVVSYLLGC